MNRSITNAIRYVMDELLPPIIRDNRLFMWPFFWLAYRKAPGKLMDFKRDVYSFTPEQYSAFYEGLTTSISRRRDSDLTPPAVEWLVDAIPPDARDILDVGCGNGYLLNRIAESRPSARLYGCDVVDLPSLPGKVEYRRGLLPELPFEDRQFDVVCCTHVLEHVIELGSAANELMRVCRGVLLVVVPRQRYYYFSLDEHVNFFHRIEPLLYHFRDHERYVQRLGGDWAVSVRIQTP